MDHRARIYFRQVWMHEELNWAYLPAPVREQELLWPQSVVPLCYLQPFYAELIRETWKRLSTVLKDVICKTCAFFKFYFLQIFCTEQLQQLWLNEDTVDSGESGAVVSIHSITPWNMHAINKVIAPPTVSSQTHPSRRNWIRGGLHSGSALTNPPAQNGPSAAC